MQKRNNDSGCKKTAAKQNMRGQGPPLVTHMTMFFVEPIDDNIIRGTRRAFRPQKGQHKQVI